MSVWRNKTNRTILLSSIFLVLVITLIVFLATFNLEKNPDTGLEWLFGDVVNLILTGLLFWAVYFNLLLLVGSVREKMNSLPGWTEVIFCMILTILPAIFLGNLDNYAWKWSVFGVASLGIILITLWFMMTSTPKEEVRAGS